MPPPPRANPPRPPMPRRSVIWVSRMIVFAVLLAIFGQAISEAILDGVPISWSLVWHSFLHRELFWFLCVGSLTAEAVALEDALERVAGSLAAD